MVQHVDALVEWWKMANPQKAQEFGITEAERGMTLAVRDRWG